MHSITYQVMKPEIDRLRDMEDFFQRSTQVTQDVFRITAQEAKVSDIFASPDFLVALAQLFGLFLAFDTLKKTKGSMNNDISIYKRTLSQVSAELISREAINREVIALQGLTLFIAQQDNYRTFFMKLFESRDSHLDEILQDMISISCQILENNELYVPLHERNRLLIVSFSLELIRSHFHFNYFFWMVKVMGTFKNARN